MHKFKLDDFENKYKKTQKNGIDCVQLHYNLQNHPTFQSEERMINLHVVRRRERFGGLSSLSSL